MSRLLAGIVLVLRGDRLVMADHLANDESEKFLGEIGIEIGIVGELAQPFDLMLFIYVAGLFIRYFALFRKSGTKRRL